MKTRHPVSSGFTLIELMIVITIIAVLLSLAVPAYQDYAVRAKVTEGLSLAAPAKLAIEESCQTDPTINIVTDTGYPGADSHYVRSVEIIGNCDNSIIIARTRNTGAARNPIIILLKTNNNNLVDFISSLGIDSALSPSWICVIGASSPAHAPSGCRFNPSVT
jgi:type IV pilus assembly protein PilA